MKRFAPFLSITLLLCAMTLPLWSATNPAAPAKSAPSDRSPVAPIASAVTAVTGIAISPLLGTGAYGAYQYFTTPAEARAALPWFAQVSFWLPALGLVGAVAAKDAAGAVLPPGWKKPLDVLETIENKVTGLVAAGAVVPFTMMAMSKMLMSSDVAATGAAAATGPALELGGVGMLHLASIDGSWLLNLLTVPFGVAVFAVVWMASHAINGLILLSPWGAIDAALKAGRTALLGGLALTAQFNPWLSAGLSVVVIVISYFVAGWSFRLSVFSSVFCWDFFTGRKGRFKVAPNANKVFAGTGLKVAPQRTYGRLVRADDGGLRFVFKPWLILAERSVAVPAGSGLAVGQGAFFSNVTDGDGEVLVLPPRYRSHEAEVAAVYGLLHGVEPIGLNRAWSWLRGATGFRPTAHAG